MSTNNCLRKITFTITEDEIRDVSKECELQILTDKQVQEVLDSVECDELLWKNIRTSIMFAINGTTAERP